MLEAKLCAMTLLSCSTSLGFLTRSRNTSQRLLLCCHLMHPSPRTGQNCLSPHPCLRPGAGRTATDREEKEQHERVTACPGAPSALWPYFNLCFKVYLLFWRKQPIGSVSYDKRVNDGLPNTGHPEPLHISGSARKTQVAKGITQCCCHKSVGIHFSKAPIAPLCQSQAKRPPWTVEELGNSCSS